MTEPVYIPNHSDRAVGNLISFFKDADQFKSLIRVFVDEVQGLEDLSYDLIVQRLLSTSIGAQLDQYGKIVGEHRDGLSDDDYRRFISARIITNLAEGEIERIIIVLSILTDAVLVVFSPAYPASYIVNYVRDGYTSTSYQQRVKDQIESITPSGVGFEIVEANIGYFGFFDDPEALGFNVGEFASII